MNLKKIFTTKIVTVFILVLVIGMHFAFSFQRIKTFTGGDETLWSYGRIPDFWDAVSAKKWKKTYISDKPGITLALISGIGLLSISDPRPYGDLMYSAKTAEQLNTIENIYFHLRLPILIFSLFALLLFYFFINKLFNERVALISSVIIGLSPLLIGMSIYINSDALLWIFLPLTMLSFLTYQKFINRKYLFVSGIFFGLALLTKFVSVILFPFLFVLIFFKYIFENSCKDSFNYFKKAFADYLILVTVSIAIIFILFPATWVKPKFLMEFTIGSKPFLKIMPIFFGLVVAYGADFFILKNHLTRKFFGFIFKYRVVFIRIICFITMGLIVFTLINICLGMKLLDFHSVLSDPRVGKTPSLITEKFYNNILSSFYPLLFGLTPIVAVAFVFTICGILGAKKSSLSGEKENTFILVVYFVFFILVYYVASAILGVSPMVRYQIALYPLVAIIGAIGLDNVMKLKQVKIYFSGNKFYGWIILLVIISTYSIYSIKPFYLEYSSFFLLKKYALNTDNSGDESWELAQYLNNLSDAKNLYIWTDVRQVCEKFIGRCEFGLKGWSSSDAYFDYFIISIEEQENNRGYLNKSNQLKIGQTFLDATSLYATNKNYAFKVTIDGREKTTIKIIQNNTKKL